MAGPRNEFEALNALCDLMQRQLNATASGGGGGGSATPVTETVISAGNGSTNTIPIGAKAWTVSFLSGTGTFGTLLASSTVSAGFSDSGSNTTATALIVTTNTPGSVYIRYEQ